MEVESDSEIFGSDPDSGPDWRFPFGMPDAANGITMVSPPESPLEELPNDQEIFQTPPQNMSTSISTPFVDCNDDGMIDGGLNHDGKTGSASSKRAVDLGGDTNSGFSGEEVDSAKKIRVSKRGSSIKGKSPTESHFERSETLDFESPSEPLGTDSKERNADKVMESLKKWNFNNVSELEKQKNRESSVEVGEGGVRKRKLDSSIHIISSASEEKTTRSENNSVKVSIKGKGLDISTEGMECDPGKEKVECENGNAEGNSERNTNTVENIDRDSVEISSKGKSLDFSTERTECDTGKRKVECKNDNSEGNSKRNANNIEHIDQVRYAAGNGSNSRGIEKTKKNGILPSLADAHPGANGRAGDEDFKKISLLDVLLKLAKDDLEEDKKLACLSLLEVAERRWGPF